MCTNPASPRRSTCRREKPVATPRRPSLNAAHGGREGAHLRQTIARPRSAKSALDTASGEERPRVCPRRGRSCGRSARDPQRKENEETKDCTFKPKVGRGPRMANRPSSARARGQAAICLSPIGCTRTGIRCIASARTLSGNRRGGDREYPFQPAINDNSRAAVEAEGYKPIHERVNDLLRKKQELLAAARVQYELENPDLTFAPKVSEASRAIARGLEEESGRRQSPVDRLATGAGYTDRPGSARSRRSSISGLRGRRRSMSAEGTRRATFRPHLNEKRGGCAR